MNTELDCTHSDGGTNDPPKIIYLQYDPDGETTWCEDRIGDEDIEYVQVAELEVAREALKRIQAMAAEDIRTADYVGGAMYHIAADARAALTSHKKDSEK